MLSVCLLSWPLFSAMVESTPSTLRVLEPRLSLL